MTSETERLIERLAGAAEPVRRLRPPLLRALLWLAAVAAISTAGVLLFADLHVFAVRTANGKLDVELVFTLLSGILAIIAAFEMSVPGSSRIWALLPLPALALWILSTGYNCWSHWIAYGPDGWTLGPTANCFRLILAFSVPLAASLVLLLRRARPLAPVKVAAMGALGVAAIAAFVLQFFHPFDVTFMDLAVHAVAVAVVVGAVSGVERLAERRRQGG